MKYDWKRFEKSYYLPSAKPVRIRIPRFRFITISGKGDPNDEEFTRSVEALYNTAYGIKMCAKKGIQTEGFFDFAVYPLEGVWDIADPDAVAESHKLDKSQLVYELMIRQPAFVDDTLVQQIKDMKSKSVPIVSKVGITDYEEGDCVQLLHTGSYDEEPASFTVIDEFLYRNGLKRKSMIHREIYLSDARRVAPDKLKTILRVQVESR
jgi:hypothetical protein